MPYRPFEKPWYVQRSIDNNPLRNGLHSTESIDTIVENIAHGNHGGISLFQRAALSGISLLTAFLIACSGGSVPPPTLTNTPVPVRTAPAPSAVSTQQVVKNGVVIKYNKTDSRGIATFVDSTTDQNVTVEVVDSSSKPLYGMRVQYLDSKDFEGFMVEDPNNQYAPLFRARL